MQQCYSLAKVLLFLLLLPCPAFAGLDPQPPTGARTISLGNAYVGMRSDFWALFHNPAGISGLGQIEGGAYLTRRFNLKELTYGSAGVVLPFREHHTAGLAFTSFGFEAYQETRLGLTYATTVLDIFSIGAQLNYASINIANYGSSAAFYVDIGVNTMLSDELSLGFSAANVNRARIMTETGEEDIPTLFTAGLAYQPSEKVLLVADVQKDVDHAVSFRGGVEYAIIPALKARLGMSNQPLTWNAGFGLALKNLDIDFAFGYHEQLRYSPHISLHYRFGGNPQSAAHGS